MICAVLAEMLTSGSALAIEVAQIESLELPTGGIMHQTTSLSVLGPRDVVLATASQGDSGFQATNWRIKEGAVTRMPASSDEHLEYCVSREDRDALCVFVSADGGLVTRALRTDGNELGPPTTIELGGLPELMGVTSSVDGKLLVWGIADLKPVAVAFDAEGRAAWTVRWSRFEMGAFHDGILTEDGAALLAQEVRDDGVTTGRFDLVRVGSRGEILSFREVDRASGPELPVLTAPSAESDETQAADETQPSKSADVRMVDFGILGKMGVGNFHRLPGGSIARLSPVLGGLDLVIYPPGDGATVTARLEGLSLGGKLAGHEWTLYATTTVVEPGPAPRFRLLLTRIELRP